MTLYTTDEEGDDLKSEDPKKAIEMFERVVELETKRGDQVKWYRQNSHNSILNGTTLTPLFSHRN